MSSSTRYERRLPELLDELAAPRTPAYFDDILGQVGRTRQRPGWTFIERWLPMSAVSQRLSAAPRVPLRAVAVAALLLIALAIGLALLAGSRKPAVPAPFGPAQNGLVAFVDEDGAIRTGLPADQAYAVIVPGPGNERPVFSPDGTRLAYLHHDPRGDVAIMVSAPDGTGAHPVNPDESLSIAYLGWTPDGRSVVVGASPGRVLAYDAATQASPTLITDKARFSGTVSGLNGFQDHLASLFRPPAGDEIAVLGAGAEGDGLYAMRRDGSAMRPLLTPQTGGLPFVDLNSPEWSPDGSRIAVTVLPPGVPEYERVIYVMNADGTGLHRLSHNDQAGWGTSENFAAWSPDGTQIAMQRWYNQPTGEVNVRPITVVDVSDGSEKELGPISFDGFSWWGWSPDGTSMLTMPADDTNRILAIDIATGKVTDTRIRSSVPATQQRTVESP